MSHRVDLKVERCEDFILYSQQVLSVDKLASLLAVYQLDYIVKVRSQVLINLGSQHYADHSELNK